MSSEILYDSEGIKKMIPHRDPFLLVDEIREAVANESIVGIKHVTGDEDFFRGHFPGHPIMPGVLIVEAMAQASGVLAVHSMDTGAEDKLVYFMTIDSARFRKPVFPPAKLELYVEQLRTKRNVYKFSGKAMVGDVLVAQATFSAMIMDRESVPSAK